MVFDDSGVSKDMMFISANQVVTSLKEYAYVYMILSNLAIETKASMGDLLVVREFPEVFPRDISGLPPERERDRKWKLICGHARSLTRLMTVKPHLEFFFLMIQCHW